MVIEKIKSQMPEIEKSVEALFRNCEKRKKIIADTPEHYKVRLEKAKHDLVRAIAEFEDKCYDWTIIKAYYSIHHAANALLSNKEGLFSKDHICLILSLYIENSGIYLNFVQNSLMDNSKKCKISYRIIHKYELIEKTLFEELMTINDKFSDILSFDIAFQLRKIGHYGVDEWKDISENDAKIIINLATRFVKFVEVRVAK